MTPNEYQMLALRTANLHERTKDLRLCNWAMGLSGETGEAVDMLKKAIHHQHVLEDDALKKELGDICWYIAVLAAEFNIEFEDLLKTNIDKLKARYPEGFSSEASLNRKDK